MVPGAAFLHDHHVEILVHINPKLYDSSTAISSFIVNANHSIMSAAVEVGVDCLADGIPLSLPKSTEREVFMFLILFLQNLSADRYVVRSHVSISLSK